MQSIRRMMGIAVMGGLVTLATMSPTWAQVIQLTTPNSLLTGDEVFSYSGTQGQVDAPLTLTGTTNTLTLTALTGTPAAGTPGNGLFYFQTSDGTSVDATAFPTGTPLLETSGQATGALFPTPSGPLKIDFAQGVKGFGLYAQNEASDTETFHLSVISALTGTTTINYAPVDNSSNQGTAVFIGAGALGNDLITSLTISSDSTQPGAANDFLFGPITAGATAPEPSSLVILAFGGIATVRTLLRRRKTA